MTERWFIYFCPDLTAAFCVDRLEWPKDQFFPAYTPRFRDGWEPPMLAYVGSSREQELNRLAETLAHAEIQRQEEVALRLSQEVREVQNTHTHTHT